MLDIMNTMCKIHPKTLNKINKQLNINNTNNINNNIILQLGKEDLNSIFTKEEKINILKKGFQSLNFLIEYTHFNDKYSQFKNILITNLQNNIAYRYEHKTNSFITISKNELLDDIINERMYNINEFYDEYKDEITNKMQDIIEKFIEKMNDNKYEEYKKKDIKLIIYNNIEQNIEIIV